LEIIVFSSQPSKESGLLSLEKDYLVRLSRWQKVTILEGSSIKFKELISKPGVLPILLDERGKEISTKDIAKKIENWQMGGFKKIYLAIGPADGWEDDMKQLVKEHWSLSKLTFPYQLSRLIIVEQLYRAFSIINNGPYHRE